MQIQRQAAQDTRKQETELYNDVKSTELNMEHKDYREMHVFKRRPRLISNDMRQGQDSRMSPKGENGDKSKET